MAATPFMPPLSARSAAFFSLFCALSLPALARGQTVPGLGPESVTVVAGDLYRAGGLHRALLGDNYRDEWTTPIKVPVLNLRTFHGGLKPTKTGGGAQTLSLRFETPDGSEYVFRSVRKVFTILGPEYKGTVIWYIARDEGSASHPLGAIAAAPLLQAANVLHPTPVVAMMPDDPALGEFRKEFGGMLGMIEEYPNVPKGGRGFAGAEKIIDSDTLLARLNTDPTTQIDARAFLTALEMDLLLGDNDRHPDQWKWVRYANGPVDIWEPLPRDRDKVFVSYEGLVMAIARKAIASLVKFDSKYSDPQAQLANATEFDRRMLQGVERSAWDSVALSLQGKITDQVIDNSIRRLPPEYLRYSGEIAAKLKARRNGLLGVADRYYRELWSVADIHATDADDQATIIRSGDGIVDVTLQGSNGVTYLQRRFDSRETSRIRLYLHGGNDRANVSGVVRRSIPIRVIGGNGDNTFVEQSVVGGDRRPTKFYDAGLVTNVKYARDTLDEKANIDNAFNHYFNRRPWQRAYGTLIPPQRDRGAGTSPVIGIHSQRLLGIYPVIGISHQAYGFRKVPYSSMEEADLAYSAASSRFRVRTALDKRFEESGIHLPVFAHMSQFEVVQFKGFGNDIPDLRGSFYGVRQRQWQIFPAVGYAINPLSDVSLGPIVRYTTTDSLANRLITQLNPYGFSQFGQAGMRLRAHYETRYIPDTLKPRAVFDITGSGYPGMWDVAKPYESLDANAAAFFTIPMPKKPVLAFRVGGKKLWGPFPYFDAAFLGGSEMLRTEERQRFAGDASLYYGSELRVPLAKFPFIIPLDVGALGFYDAGRVYVNGDSPGGWHSAAGGGLWFGFRNPGINFNILVTNNPDRRIVTNFGFAY
jgi:hypothetical protein